MKKLKCFIASAFGKKDVDAIYTKVVTPVLRQKNIMPIRVDRVDHNDDIDDKILESIKQCDFCIADLTYARPSVYYEAGLVHGTGKPVIFLAHSSHFNPKEDDEFGNFRVHFDLQMKNIIQWTTPTITLQKKLGSRINVVTKPLLRSLQEEDQRRVVKAQFQKLPHTEKFHVIFEQVGNALATKKFKLDENDRRWKKHHVIGVKKVHGASVVVWCLAEPSFTKSRLEHIKNAEYGSPFVLDFLERMNIDQSKNMKSHILCCSLRPTPESRIADALPYFHSHDHHKLYSYYRTSRPNVESSTHIHFLDGIDSVDSFCKQLGEHLPLIGKLGKDTCQS